MRWLLFVGAAVVSGGALAAPPPPLDGDWDGALKVPAGIEVPLVLHLAGAGSTLGSPDQGNGAAPVTVTRDGAKVDVAIPSTKSDFAGILSADGKTLAGTFSQGGMSMPAHFARRAAGAAAPTQDRPQTPKPPFPYKTIDVSIPAGNGVTLAGTLTRPATSGRVPAVLLIAGSGPENRDETLAGHKPFFVLADMLTRAGIAVLRYDKRGVGGSTGRYADATGDDLIADAAAAFAWLRRQPGIAPARVGLIGHSEGAEIAPEVAGRDPKVAFLVLLSAPGMTGDRVILTQKEAIEHAMGVPQETIGQGAMLESEILQLVLATSDPAAIEAKVDALLVARGVAADQVRSLAGEAASPAFRMLLGHDPIPPLRALTQPVLVIAGDKDLQVVPGFNLPPIRAALADNRRAEIVELPGLNHLLQPAKTGTPEEYGGIATTLDPKVLEIVGRWVVKTAR